MWSYIRVIANEFIQGDCFVFNLVMTSQKCHYLWSSFVAFVQKKMVLFGKWREQRVLGA